MNETITPALPSFFRDQDMPSVMKWAMDKGRYIEGDPLICEGRVVRVESWYFVGKMPRKTVRFWQQWDSPADGKQYTAAMTLQGGVYKGQKETAHINFTVYTAEDGCPLPTK